MKVSAIPTTYESLTPIYVDQNRSDAWRENNCLQKTETNIIYEVHVQKQKFALLLHYWQVQPEPL